MSIKKIFLEEKGKWETITKFAMPLSVHTNVAFIYLLFLVFEVF